ncbi:MAG TPA: ammonia channel protein, partial [Accumulibacter sp.]|nr:ammonia channel protein [Accumulibacter sp.]
MKRLLTILALLGAIGVAAPAAAEEKPAAAMPVSGAVAGAESVSAAAAPGAPGAPAAAASSPAAPAATPTPQANKGDNAWVMISAAFVILMSIPGLALFYGGLVRSKNMLSVLMQVFVTFSLISIL